MTLYTVRDMAEAQAIGLCWLARSRGLPDITSLRTAVVVLHPDECSWCDYPMDELLRMLETRQTSERDERVWWELPGKARLRAITLAQGIEA